MMTTIRVVCAALLAVGFARARAEVAPFQEPAALVARPRSALEVLGSWTGAIARARAGEATAIADERAAVTSSRGEARPLSSWTGVIASGAPGREPPAAASPAAARARAAPQVVASWTGSIGERAR
jgi:hypothetical protein